MIPRGCIIGSECVIGENVKLPEFSRITLCRDMEEDNQFDDFHDDDDFEEIVSSEKSTSEDSRNNCCNKGSEEVETDHALVGEDGIGQLWLPSANEQDFDVNDSDSESEVSNDKTLTLSKSIEWVKSRSIGYDPTGMFFSRMKAQEEGEDYLSDEESIKVDDNQQHDELSCTFPAGVDIVKELKLICLEHDVASPIENLRIELNSFKFSQNASFSDCVTGTILAILEKVETTSEFGTAKLITEFKSELNIYL